MFAAPPTASLPPPPGTEVRGSRDGGVLGDEGRLFLDVLCESENPPEPRFAPEVEAYAEACDWTEGCDEASWAITE